MENWAKHNGAYFRDGVAVSYSEDRGSHIITHKPVEPNEILLSIPYAMAISPITILNSSEFGKMLFEKCRSITLLNDDGDDFVIAGSGKDENVCVTFTFEELICSFLVCDTLIEKESFWTGYLQSLPKDIPAALLWDDDEIQNDLGGCGLDAVIRTRRRDLMDGLVKNLTDAFSVLSLSAEPERFLWAYVVIKSRGFLSLVPEDPESLLNSLTDLPLEPKEKQELLDFTRSSSCLLPLLDCCNHEPGTPIVWERSQDGISFRTPVAIKEGSEVFNNYGPKSNEELLLSYGFCLESELQSKLEYVRLSLRSGSSDDNASTVYLKHDMNDLPRLIEMALMMSPPEDDVLKRELVALRNIILALDHKSQNIEDALHICIETLDNSYKARCAAIYLKDQSRIITKAIDALLDTMKERALTIQENSFYKIIAPSYTLIDSNSFSEESLDFHVKLQADKDGNLCNAEECTIPAGTVLADISGDYLITVTTEAMEVRDDIASKPENKIACESTSSATNLHLVLLEATTAWFKEYGYCLCAAEDTNPEREEDQSLLRKALIDDMINNWSCDFSQEDQNEHLFMIPPYSLNLIRRHEVVGNVIIQLNHQGMLQLVSALDILPTKELLFPYKAQIKEAEVHPLIGALSLDRSSS